MIESFLKFLLLLDQKECFPGEENSWTGIWLSRMSNVLEHSSDRSAKACLA